jgi:hypothetical protein
MDALTIEEAVFIDFRMGDGEAVKLDPLDANEAILAAQGKHGVTMGRTRAMRSWYAEHLGVDEEKISLDEAAKVTDAIIAIAQRLIDERKKKVSETVDSLLSTLGFPPTSEDGQSEKKTPGSETSSESTPPTKTSETGSTTTPSTDSTSANLPEPETKTPPHEPAETQPQPSSDG